MVLSHLFTYVISISCLIALIGTGTASAQNPLEGFFSRNGAQTPFSEDIKITDPRETVMLRPKEEAPLEPEAEEFAKKSAPLPEPEQPKDRHLNQPGTVEEILETYGDPASPYPVAATEDAPGPFKAMYAAMNAGNDELAFKYAIQYVKFREQLKAQNKKAVSIMGHAQRKAGLLPEGSWPDSSSHSEYAYLQDLEIEEASAKEEQQSDRVDVTDETRKLIARLQETDFDLFDDKKQEIKQNLAEYEQQERDAVRAELAAKLPVSPSGAVDIFVFLKPTQDESLALAPEIQRLHETVQKVPAANLAVFFLSSFSSSQLSAFRSRTNTTMPVLPGLTVAGKLGLKTSPAVIFVTKEGKSHLEAGLQNFYRLDEIRKIIQGEKQ